MLITDCDEVIEKFSVTNNGIHHFIVDLAVATHSYIPISQATPEYPGRQIHSPVLLQTYNVEMHVHCIR